jgi:hypothetical protein
VRCLTTSLPFSFAPNEDSMSWTQTDVDNIRAAITAIAVRGAAEVTINGRTVRYSNPNELQKLLESVEADVNAATYSPSLPVAFGAVDNR